MAGRAHWPPATRGFPVRAHAPGSHSHAGSRREQSLARRESTGARMRREGTRTPAADGSSRLLAGSQRAPTTLGSKYTSSDVCLQKMEESEENILAKETHCLQDINPKYILKALVDHGTLTEQEQYEILDYENLPQQRNELFALLKKKDAWFSSLIHVLEMDDSYPWIAKVLKSHEDNKNQVETLLKKGGVPFKPNHLVLRKTLLDQIKLALKSICQTDSRRGWVVLHGMPGIGKSILAAEALNDPELTLAYFQDGVWWLSVGKSATEGALFNKLQNLYERITKSQSENLPIQGLTLDDLSNNLKFCMAQAGLKRSLLVVDDIINESFVKYFDIGCPVLVTTTVSSLFENVSGKKEIVKIEDAFSREQGKELLASYCKTSVSELPLEADLIIKYCRGFPMELAMVGSYLARFAGKPSLNERWKCCVENYEKPGRRRNTSGDHQNLERAIELCISQLSSEIEQYFNDFVIFTEDTSIPSKITDYLKSWENVQRICNIEEFGWELVSHPPCSPDVAFSDFHLFHELKKNLGGTQFQDDDELEEAVLGFLRGQTAEFFDSGFHKWVS
ncbi:APAF1 [Cordylochernes scorpioides]|uniref:APAF1 n=1 Tax=Cordylochernes scorpioides TaxID=51811 RepID=A0ABY6L5F3_9ARAC|nr:APAF1 [Cordylochernes scorpioides]